MFAELRGDGWNVYLEASEWRELKRVIESLYRATIIWSNISVLPGDAAVLYYRVRTSSIKISSLSSYAELRFESWFPNKKVYVAELSAPVYSLHVSQDLVKGRLKIVDWGSVESVQEGWASILLQCLNGSVVRLSSFYGQGYIQFEARNQDGCMLWAIIYAPCMNNIFLNNKYGKILMTAGANG